MSKYISKPLPGVTINPLHPLSKGLVGLWLFNEGAGSLTNDISGYNNHGSLIHMLANSQTTGWCSKKENCVGFDGLNDYIDCGNNSIFDITDAISLQIRVNGTTLVSNAQANQSLIGKAANLYEIRYDKANTKFYGRFTLSTGNKYPTILNNPLEKTWYDIIVTYGKDAGNNNLVTYVNGIKTFSYTETGTINTSASAIVIGKNVGYLHGFVTKASIYKRMVSPQEAKQLYQDPYCMLH